MEVFQIEGVTERSAMTALCLNPVVLAAVAPTWQDDCLPSKWANIVARWAVRYFDQFKTAPGIEGITALYADWAQGANKDTAEIVHKWLSGLDPETGVASDYSIQQIQRLVTRTAAKRLAEKIQGALANGKAEEAAALIESWKRPTSAQQLDYLSVFEHKDAIEAELAAIASEPLIKYKGALGQFINPLFVRESFVAFLAPAKRGKSTILMDIGWTAAMQGRKVAYFSTGDMSRGQILDRLRVKASKRPKFPCTFKIPTALKYEGKEPKITYRTYSETVGLQGTAGVDAFAKYAQDDRFRIVAKSASTISAGDIAATVQRWADNGWVADVVVIDYADILRGPTGIKEPRDQINENWIAMSALRTDMKCCVITATQADTEGMDAWCLSIKNFNGDRRKWDHVTGAIGINCTIQEKKAGVFRLNHLVLREGEFAVDLPMMVGVAGSTKVGAPIIISEWV